MELLSLIKSLAAILSTSVMFQASPPAVAPPVPRPEPIVVEKKEPEVRLLALKQSPENIHSVQFDREKNAFILSIKEDTLLLSFLRLGSLEVESLGFLNGQDIDFKSISTTISPQNELFITWIQKGHVHLATWSFEASDFVSLDGGSTNISGSLDPYNLKPKIFFTEEGKLYLTWLLDPTKNIPESFHTQSIPHHDFYITTWTGKEWQKLDGRPWFERFSDYFPSSLSIYEYDLTFDEEQQPVIIWTRLPEEVGFEKDSRIYMTRFKPDKGWQSYDNPEKVLSIFEFSNWIQNPFITYQEDEFILGWQSGKLNEEQIEPQVYSRKQGQWISISPSESVDTKRFTLKKTFGGITLLDFRLNNIIARQYKDGKWTRFADYKDFSSPYQTVLPLLPQATYFIDPQGPVLLSHKNKLWTVSPEKAD